MIRIQKVKIFHLNDHFENFHLKKIHDFHCFTNIEIIVLIQLLLHNFHRMILVFHENYSLMYFNALFQNTSFIWVTYIV